MVGSALLNEGIELIEVDRFYQVIGEADIITSANIFLHSEAGQRNSEKRTATMETRHQINATAIG